MTKKVTISDFLTDQQIEAAVIIYDNNANSSMLVDLLEEQIIAPNMAVINQKLGQENNSRYLAYALVYVLSQVR